MATICGFRSALPQNIMAAGFWANTGLLASAWIEAVDSCAHRD